MRVQVPPVEQDYRPRLLYSPSPLSYTTPAPSGPLWRNTSHRLLLLYGDSMIVSQYTTSSMRWSSPSMHWNVVPLSVRSVSFSVLCLCVLSVVYCMCAICSGCSSFPSVTLTWRGYWDSKVRLHHTSATTLLFTKVHVLYCASPVLKR